VDERNKYLEMDGLVFETEKHEWFADKTNTAHARRKTITTGGQKMNDSLNVACFVARNKETGEYERVMIDIKTNEPVFATQSFEDMAVEIDRRKIMKRFSH
jgi:hypothetical protein